ncbi:EF-P 5-aminopentanol modification-associated protein YfmH [Oceanobacillus sp. J11TS1]|uniref:EF-P 5-aminopentanol modification-associated protein YfmH n=1 Tax=Oceanobacillus sp. J11TS1 TaxID=2807191 RepID=UPI001B093820|nr:pitrilysin family protein [Oceanobacillus sp. J11TS1]GIO22028.1 peptidase M16 [Oceanobacillus sp. J11TS1]
MNKQYFDTVKETLYEKKLDNGLHVCLLPKPELSKTYGVFMTNYGSIDRSFVPIGQDEAITVPDGIAHFLEHKLFEKEDRDVFADFTKQAASPNAFTSFTETAYLFSATSNIEKNVLTLIDFVQDPYFSEQSVEKEKGIIAQEINMYDDQPDWRLFMGTNKALFHNHPVNIDIAGTVDSIYTITKDDLYTCYHTFYHPENMILFIAGNFDPQQMMDLISDNQQKKSFDKLEDIQRSFPEEPDTVKEKNLVINMPVSISKCAVGIKEPNQSLQGEEYLKRDLLVDMVLSHFFSTGGEFYQELYEADLIDNSFFFESNLQSSFGYSCIGTNTTKPEEFSSRVHKMLLSTRDMEISEKDFERMKKKKMGQLLRGMNSLEFIANQFASYSFKNVNLFEIVPFIQKLTVDDANGFLKNWIEEERLATCTITNQSEEK